MTSFSKKIEWLEKLVFSVNKQELNIHDNKVIKFIYDADCPYLGTEDYYECEVNGATYVFGDNEHRDLAQMLKEHKGIFVLSSKTKKKLRKLYRSNGHYVLYFEATGRIPDKRHREQLPRLFMTMIQTVIL